MADPYRYFRVEARELLEQLGQDVLDLEKGAAPHEVIGRLLRLAHTLKGAARVVRQPEIAEQAHALEDVFGALRESTAPPQRDQIDLALGALDRIGALLARLTPGRAPEAGTPAPTQPDEPVYTFRPAVEDLEDVRTGVAAAQDQLGAIRSRLDQADRIRHLADVIEGQLVRLRGRMERTEDDRPALDKALSMLDELRGRFGRLQEAVEHGVDQLDRELRGIGDAGARLRLAPASSMFRFLERAARDAARALDRPVTFDGRGGDVRVDSGILTIVQGALLHLVRNAVAHGIESDAGERLAAGKPAHGQVTVAISRRGTAVSFVCSDDGRGIDFEEVRRVLERAGVPAAEVQALDQDALLRRLLQGGVSTSGSITGVAGRGVGLDVVREAAERLRGSVSLRSEPGVGTTVNLSVPASVASFPALLVETAGITAAVPLEAVARTCHLAAEQTAASAEGEAILVDGRHVPVSPLPRVLRFADADARAARTSAAFIVTTGAGTAAFAVDRILGAATVVMQPLPELAPAAPSVAGASFDAAGQLRLVLDPAGLIAEAQRIGAPPPAPPPPRAAILVVDDSLTTRMLEQSILESAGYDVTVASSGEEALEKARRRRYALFVIDVEMPGMDGFALLEELRADPALRDIPSIMVTSRASAADRQRGRDAGARDYIVKSDFDQGALLERIRMLVP